MMRSNAWLPVLAALALGSCGGDSGLDQKGADKTFRSIGNVLIQVEHQITLGVGYLTKTDGSWTTGTQAAFSIGGELAGNGGGKVAAAGSGSNVGGVWTESFTMTFTAYVDATEGLTLDGALTISNKTDSVGTASAQFTATGKGRLQLSGGLTGTADVDLSFKSSPETGGVMCGKGSIGGQKVGSGGC